MKEFIFTILKSINPKYFHELFDRDYKESIKYFFLMLFFAFLLMGVISIPKYFLIQSDITQGSLNIEELTVGMEFTTTGPVIVPKYNPFITIDTTGNETFDSEWIHATDELIHFKYFGEEKKIPVEAFHFQENPEQNLKAFSYIGLFLIPSFFFFYYVIYLAKYLIIIIPFALISYLFARFFRNSISLKGAISMSFYSSTAMVFLEILTLPFFINKYMFTYTPFIGINFSIFAITVYLMFFVTAVRIVGNKNLRA